MINISFIIPTYNDSNYIGACLESVSALKGQDYEFIVVDDGSSDGTAGICDSYAEKDSRFRVIHQKNQGVSVARNEGIRTARGRWLCFIDGDDSIIPENLEEKVFPGLDEESDIVYFFYDEEAGGEIIRHEPRADKTCYSSPEEIEAFHCTVWNLFYPKTRRILVPGVSLSSPWGKLYRADFIRKNGLHFVPGVIRAQDQLFNGYVYLYVRQVRIIPVTGYLYRVRAGKAYPYRPDLMKNDAFLLEEHQKYLALCRSRQVHDTYDIWLCVHMIRLMRLEFCNPENPKSYRIRKKEFNEYMDRERVRQAFARANLEDAGKSRNMVLKLIKRRWFFILNIYYKNYKNAAFFAKIRNNMDR